MSEDSALYLNDCYMKEFDATIASADRKYVVLDKTAFYPSSGGQPHDTGTIKRESDGKVFRVVFVGRFSGKISHEVDDEGLAAGDRVACGVDWDRRYNFMRQHTGSHVLSAVIHKETGALITGNQIAEDKTRIDFSLENFDREQIRHFEERANEIISKNIPVRTYFISRHEAEGMPEIARLAKGLPSEVERIRIVEIGGFDRQACGGTHVKSTGEIGRIRITDAANKGRNNRRIYFILAK